MTSLFPVLQTTINALSSEFSQIPSNRRDRLAELTEFMQERLKQQIPVSLNFICTHNSRRSHISQLWATAAAWHYGINDVYCYSGGTESTAFNERAVKAMQTAGFSITSIQDGNNPVYEVHFAAHAEPVIVFSKRYDDPINPTNDFAAVMTCSDADENCPLITGAIKRIALTYDDPKHFDGTPLEESKYAERVREIGREILYAFSKVATPKINS